MHYHILCAVYRLKGALDKVRARLHKHLDGNILRNVIPVYKRAQYLVFRFGGGGKAHLYLLEAHPDERFEKFQLFFKIHRVNKRLVAVS